MATKEPDDDLMADVMKQLAALTRLEQAVERQKDVFGKAVAAAMRGNHKPAELIKRTGKSAETIRQIARANGVERLRPPTTMSYKKIQENLAAAGIEVDEATLRGEKNA